MRISRTALAAGLLVVEAALATMGVLVHYSFTAEYGDATGSSLEEWLTSFTAGLGGVALVIVGTVALPAALVSPRPWMRWAAVVMPVLLVGGMLAVTPAALAEKLEAQYTSTPQCHFAVDEAKGPGYRAARDSQRAFDSIEHVGAFGGGGGSGVGGCDRSFLLTEEVDVLGHYRAVLPAGGWRVVEDRANHVRAERDGMAFEVTLCGSGGVVWAGAVSERGSARCDLAVEAVHG